MTDIESSNIVRGQGLVNKTKHFQSSSQVENDANAWLSLSQGRFCMSSGISCPHPRAKNI